MEYGAIDLHTRKTLIRIVDAEGRVMHGRDSQRGRLRFMRSAGRNSLRHSDGR